MCVCVCVCARTCVRACMRACVRERVHACVRLDIYIYEEHTAFVFNCVYTKGAESLILCYCEAKPVAVYTRNALPKVTVLYTLLCKTCRYLSRGERELSLIHI